MKIINTKIKDLRIIQHSRHIDKRGNLKETYNKKIINFEKFVFEYVVLSKKNVLRGLHFQTKFQQAKLITVLKGKILDVVVDLRKKSKTFGKTFSIVLSEQNCKSLYVPSGFAHAYYCYSNLNIVYYKLSNFYKPKFESGIIWNDDYLKIKWPIKKPILSNKDKKLKKFNFFVNKHRSL